MPSKSMTVGACALCGQQASMAKLATHLASCAPAHDAPGPEQSLLLLRVMALHDRRYWILAEARSNATLQQLDSLLRELWLECCGHLSAFIVARRKLSMNTTVATAFGSPGLTFQHEYDFGSTTTLLGQVVGARQGSLGRSPVRVVARNLPLNDSCAQCASLATLVCPYCIGGEEAFLFCDAHAATHEHADEDVYLPVVNSPRMGVCGYAG